MIDQINLFTGDASIQYSITLNIILLAAIVILTLIFYLIARKRKYERLVKEKQLDTQQKFARELLDSVPAGFILLTPNGTIKQVNRQATTELGVQKQDIRDKNIREVFSIFHENLNILDKLLSLLQKDEQEVTLPPDNQCHLFSGERLFQKCYRGRRFKLYNIYVPKRRDRTYPRIRVEHGPTPHENISLVIRYKM